MSFNFSQTSGNSGITTISLSATSTTDVEAKVENYTLSNDSGSSVLMQVIQKAYKPVEKYINLKPSSIEWDGSGGTSSLQIQSNDNWVITSNSWIELSRFGEADRGLPHNTISGNGNTIIGIRALENTGTTRTGGITGHCISNSAISATTTVVQNTYIKPYIELSYYSINCDSTGTTSSFTISSNVDWYIVVDESWASVNTESGSGNANITFTVNENTSSIARSCDIAVYARNYDIKVVLAIKQDATQTKPYIILNPDSFVVSDKGSTGNTISISANCSYDITTETDWITLHSSSGSGDGTVTFDTDPASFVKYNNGLIEFSNSALSRYVIVVREAPKPYLYANVNTLTFGMSGGSQTISIYSNVGWYVVNDSESERSWLTVSPSSGNGNGSLTITLESGSTFRRKSVVIANDNYNLSAEIDVMQLDESKTFIYTSTDGNVVVPVYIWGNANVVSNTYENGIGIITFDRTISTVPSEAFKNRETLASVMIPDSVRKISSSAFYGTSIESITIGEQITQIGRSAFQKTHLKDVYFNAIDCVCSAAANATSIWSSLYDINLHIGNNVERINDCAFGFYESVTGYDGRFIGEVVIPDSVTYIGKYAFGNCTKVTKFVLGKNVAELDEGGLNGYSSELKEIYSYNPVCPIVGDYNFIGGRITLHYPNGSDYSRLINAIQYSQNWTFIDNL